MYRGGSKYPRDNLKTLHFQVILGAGAFDALTFSIPAFCTISAGIFGWQGLTTPATFSYTPFLTVSGVTDSPAFGI